MIGKKVMLLDLNSCSGCHACSVSCKAEHRAPNKLCHCHHPHFVDFLDMIRGVTGAILLFK